MLVSISIPHNAKIKANVNDKLNFNDPLFEVIDEQSINIDIARKLKVQPDKMFRHLTCIVGEEVVKGKVIAKKTTLFSSIEFVCEYSGTLQNVNNQDGTIDIKIQNSERKIVNSFFKGTLEKIDKYKIQVEIERTQKIEAEEISLDFGGEIFNFKDESQYFSMGEDEIKNHVIVGQNLKLNTLAKFKTLGAVGYIFEQSEIDPSTPYAKATDLSKFETNKKYCLVSNLDKTIYLY